MRYGVYAGRGKSFIGRNVVLLCSRFKWQFNDFVCGNAMLVLIIMSFCIIFIVVLGMMIGLLFSS